MVEIWEKQVLEADYDKGRRAILTPAGAIVPASGGAEQKQTDGTNFPYYVLDFDKGSDEAAYWVFMVPDDYDGGNITVNIWYKTTVEVNDVIFNVHVLGREEGEALDAALGGAQAVTDTVPGTAGTLGVCAPSAFDPSWTAGDLVVVKLLRDADNGNDDADADVSVVMVEVAY